MQKNILYIGRFQPFHSGHADAVQQILEKYPEISLIGIGAGRGLHAQVLVFDDVVGRTDVSKFSPKFVHAFGNAEKTESQAVQDYISSVQTQKFPSEKHIFR